MHTFFINTTKDDLRQCNDILEIKTIQRQLVPLACPFSDWNDEKKGYLSCVDEIEEKIDNYKDINNTFNLLVFVDSLEFETLLPKTDDRRMGSCYLKALKLLIGYFIKESIFQELENRGRKPADVLVIIEGTKPSEEDPNLTDAELYKYVAPILGLPSWAEDVKEWLEILKPEEHGALTDNLCNIVKEKSGSSLADKFFCYLKYLKPVFDSFLSGAEKTIREGKKGRDGITETFCKDHLFEPVGEECRKAENDIVSFYTDRKAGSTNKQLNSRRNLMLSFYLLDCIEKGTLKEEKAGSAPKARPFPGKVDWDRVEKLLSEKRDAIQKEYNKLRKIDKNVVELGLAPKMKSLDVDMFGLDEYGYEKTELVCVKVEKDKEADGENTVSGGDVKVEEVKDERNNLISGFDRFDYNLIGISPSEKKKKAPAQNKGTDKKPEKTKKDAKNSGESEDIDGYRAAALNLMAGHKSYLRALEHHVSDRLARYDGRSLSFSQSFLPKRRVSIGDSNVEEVCADTPYNRSGKDNSGAEIETVLKTADRARSRVYEEYMEFCRGRSVALTNIGEQVEWFEKRLNQIKAGIVKTGFAAGILLALVLILYVPFVILQWDGIVKNPLTVTIALVSIAIPLVLLFFIFIFVRNIKKESVEEEWKKLQEKSNDALDDNVKAVKKFDDLLCVYIPALRYVTYYKNDAEFQRDVSMFALAKLDHHKNTLRERLTIINNIIEDLENEPGNGHSSESSSSRSREKTGNPDNNPEIDYNVPFCAGEKNMKFYSIVGDGFLGKITKEGGN